MYSFLCKFTFALPRRRVVAGDGGSSQEIFLTFRSDQPGFNLPVISARVTREVIAWWHINIFNTSGFNASDRNVFNTGGAKQVDFFYFQFCKYLQSLANIFVLGFADCRCYCFVTSLRKDLTFILWMQIILRMVCFHLCYNVCVVIMWCYIAWHRSLLG